MTYEPVTPTSHDFEIFISYVKDFITSPAKLPCFNVTGHLFQTYVINKIEHRFIYLYLPFLTHSTWLLALEEAQNGDLCGLVIS